MVSAQSFIAGLEAGLEANSIDAETPPEWFHDGQLAVWDDPRREVIACAGTQGGKTAGNAHWLLREIYRTRHLAKKLGSGNYIYAGPTLTLLEAQAIPAFESLFVDELKLGKLVKGNKPKFYFSEEGAVKVCGFPVKLTVHFAYTNDSQNLESMTALAAVWDEVGQPDNKEASFEAMNRRLKVARSQGFGRRLFTTTPYEWNWFKRRIVDIVEKFDAYGYHSWPSWMNPMFDKAEADAELEEGMELWRWEMMYMAKWTRPAGAVFPSFDSRVQTELTGETNVIEKFRIPKDWKIYAGWDFGSANTASVLIAKNPEEEVFYAVWDYHGGGHESKHIAAIEAVLNGRKLNGCFGGASSEDSSREAYSDEGFVIHRPLVTGADSLDVAIKLLNKLFSQKRLKIFSSCTSLIREIEGYTHKIGDNGESLELIVDKAMYHRLDALRYVMVSIADAVKPQVIGGKLDKLTRT